MMMLNPYLNHAVFVSYDGCCDEKPVFTGKRDDCLAFMRKHWKRYNVGKQSLDMMDLRSGRLVSFVL